jgi:hypothetical protein
LTCVVTVSGCGQLNNATPPKVTKVGVISDSHKISDSIPRICRNDASKLAPSLHPRLTAREPGRPDGRAKIKMEINQSKFETSNVIFEKTI